MFEAVIAVCLGVQAEHCRDSLIPGYEAASLAECEAKLRETPVEQARCAEVGAALAVVETAPGLFAHLGQIAEPNPTNRGDVSNMGFVIGEESVAVIDTGSAAWIGEALWRAIRAETDLPISHVVLTHMHPDHVFGTRIFEEQGAEIVAHSKMPRALADRQENYLESLERLIGPLAFAGTIPPKVTQTVETSMVIDLGNRPLELQSWPSAHTSNDLTVFDTNTGTLFTGDLIFHRHTPALDGSLRGWQAVLAEMAGNGAQRIIPGHGGPVLPWPEGSESVARYLDVLARDTAAAVAAGERIGHAVTHIADEEAELWDLFDAFNPRNATVAFKELEWE